MSRVWPLLVYKIRFFFGPALRGRLGPLAYIGLILLFLPSGYAIGLAIGHGILNAPAAQRASILSGPLNLILAIGFLYSVFSGVTAHVSEFDFFMTGDIRPREYLLADLMFQFFTLSGAGGLASVVAAFGIVASFGRPLVTVLPMVLCLFAFALVVLMIIQIVVVFTVRYPKRHVRSAAIVLFFLALLPAASLAYPGFPLHLQDLPLPTTAFGTLGYDVLVGISLDPANLAVALVTVAAVVGLWVAVSDTYIFHGIHPSLSAGFGQVDMAARMAQQRRMTAGFGKLTTGITVRTDRGNDTSYMTRYHLLRIVRDGSIVFIALFGIISLMPVSFSSASLSSAEQAPVAYLATQMLTFLVAVLALNWSYYERENLWIVVTAARSPAPYFRGLLVSFMVLGLIIAGIFAVFVVETTPGFVPLNQLAIPIGAAVASALVSTALLTRLKVQPSAFSLSMLAILVAAVVSGYMSGFFVQTLLLIGALAIGMDVIAQAVLLAAYCGALAAVGLWWVSRLAAGFRL
ncbi:MAG TPA: hypothetical protein VEY12_02965 [Thermoplasmata archaeon]|nr:hypothetical protein [Thermoplasmata archaeon]